MNDESLCGLAFQGRGLKLNLLINQDQIGDVEDKLVVFGRIRDVKATLFLFTTKYLWRFFR